jgi:hypothetical protein
MARPYQPSLLRLFHGATAVLVGLAWLSGLLLFNEYDHRWGQLPLPSAGDGGIDWHGKVGLVLIGVSLLFVLVSYGLRRRTMASPSNGLALVALSLALGSGWFMEEEWMVEGGSQHLIYNLHLLGWILLVVAVALHLLEHGRRGGWPLLSSMLSPRMQRGDQPRHWLRQLGTRLRQRP